MADTLTHFEPFKITFPDGAVTMDPATGEKSIDLSSLPSATSVAAAQATANVAQAAADTAQVDATAAQTTANLGLIFAASGFMADATITGNPQVFVPILYDGTLDTVSVAGNFTPDAQVNLEVARVVSTNPLVTAAVTMPPLFWADNNYPGDAVTQAPTAANTLSAGDCLVVTHTAPANTVAGHLAFEFGFTRTA